jgi:hypothetical protein
MSGKVAVERMLAYLPHIAAISLNSRRSLGHDLCSGKLRLGYAVIRYIGTPRESFYRQYGTEDRYREVSYGYSSR